ncbi:MAG: hypothetical protein IPN67_21805 [Bacteroidales bacterium]|nr:hypothetical protein [Bacteroidales bacterium]
MKRRNFIKTTAGAAILSPIAPIVQHNTAPGVNKEIKATEKMSSSIQIRDNQLFVETHTQTAIFIDGFLSSLKNKQTGEEYIQSYDHADYSALQLIYSRSETVDFNEKRYGKTSLRQNSDQQAEFIFHSWDGDGVVTISADNVTGDLIVEQSAYSSRPGLLACRWNIPGIKQHLQLVAPFFQGVRLKLDDPLIKDSRWAWPMYWEAGLAILQSEEGGFYLHTRDTEYRYKALKVGSDTDPFVLGMDTEAYGPVDNNLAAGGLTWRINVYKGGWQVPAEIYRNWLWGAYGLAKEEEKRKAWIKDVRLAVSWCPGDPAVLDALAKKITPSKVLLHFPDWRTDIYDQNYPSYLASESGKSFISKCRKMGFHIMPHFNSIDMDPSHPAYAFIRDFQYRDLETKHLMGWSWVNGSAMGVPESNANRMTNRDKNVMIKVHPGLSMWRSILGENIYKAASELDLDCVFIDVTLVTQNLHNCLVESMTSTEGMKRLIEHTGLLGKGLVVGGEGLNEITMQGQSFAQAHLFKSWQTSTEGLERAGGCDLNSLLFGRLCRTIGYSGLGGNTKDEELRMQIHIEHGAIPTITINSANEVLTPNSAVKHMFDLANS